MSLTAGTVRALERHFVGVLSFPSRLWLDSVPLEHVVVTGGDALRIAEDGPVVDFGTAESPGTERQVVRIASPRPEVISMKIDEVPPWLTARWMHTTGEAVCVEQGAAADMELLAEHDVFKQTDFAGTVRIALRFAGRAEQREELLVRLTARRTHPFGVIDFHGSPYPRGLDFGIVDPLVPAAASYELAFDSLTSVPLTVAFSDLPAWLTFRVDGHQRIGPAPGRFFERSAPFKVSIRPHQTTNLIGAHQGSIRLETNDPRPSLRSIDLRFVLRVEPAGPFLRALPESMRITTSRPVRTDLPVENCGRTPARIAAASIPPSLKVLDGAIAVPAANGGRPGGALVPLRVLPTRLTPGAHVLALTFSVEGGPPLQVALPVEVTPAALSARKPVVAPAAAAALFALLAFTLLIVLYLRVAM